jgi:uncharacterized RDD family membrane protein YckC
MDQFSDQLNIETPELVDIELPVAGLGSRFIAILIDYLIWIAGFIVLSLLAAVILPNVGAFSRMSENWAVAIFTILSFLLYWGYFTLFEALWSGRTPGKRVAKIRVIHNSGRAINFYEAIARNFIRVIDQFPLIYGVGVLFVFITKQHQRLGDLAAGTLVVREQESETPAWGNAPTRTFTSASFLESAAQSSSSSTPPPVNYVPLPANDVAKLSTNDLEVLEGFFARRLDMSMETRASLAERIAKALCAKTGLEIPEGVNMDSFLDSIAHQLRETVRYKR